MKEGFKPRAPKKEIPPDIHKAFQGTSFSDEDILSLATLLAEGKVINVASFTGVKHKLYEKGVKDEIQTAADRIKAIYASTEGVKVNNSLFEDHLVKQYVLGKFASKPAPSLEDAIDPAAKSPPASGEEIPQEDIVLEKSRKRGTLSVGDNALEASIEIQKQRLANNKITKEARDDTRERLDVLQSFSTDETRTRHKMQELESQLSSKNISESDKGKIEEERDELRRKLNDTTKEKSLPKTGHQQESGKDYTNEPQQTSVPNEATSLDSSVLELTPDQIISEAYTSRDARSPREYTQEDGMAALKGPMQNIAGLQHSESTEDGHTVGENRTEFQALRDKLQPNSGESTAEKDILELSEEYKPQTVEAAPAERAVLTEAENEYLAAYTKFHANKKFWNSEPKALKALEKTYNEARLGYADALDVRLGGRMLEKYTKRNVPLMVPAEDGTLIQNPLLDPARADRVRERYNRLIRFNEVIKPAAEKKLAARTEALSEKDQGIASKAYEKYLDINKSLELKYGKQGARAIRSVMFAAVFTAGATLGAAGLAAIGVGSFSSAALYAAVGIIPAKAAKSFVSGLVGGRLGVSLSDTFQASRFGNASVEKGRENLSNLQQSGRTISLNSVEDLEGYDKKQANLSSVASGEQLRRNKFLIQFLTSVGLGVGTAEVISHWNSIEHLVVGDSTESAAVSNTDTPSSTKSSPLESSKVPGVRPDTTPAKVEFTVAKGEGANQLFQDLKAHYPDPEHYPTNIKALLNHQPAEVAKILGFGRENGGIMLHPQDSISLNDQGRLIFHDHLHNKDIVVMDEKGISDEWSTKVHKLHEAHTQSTTEHHPKRVHTVSEHVKSPRPHIKSFDAKADQEAVAAANRAEFAREQSGDFSVITTVPADAVSQSSVIPETPPALETQAPSGSSIPQSETPSTSLPESTSSTPIDTARTPEAPAAETISSAPRSEIAPTEAGTPSGNSVESAILPAESIDKALPHTYLTNTGEVTVFGGTLDQRMEWAKAYAQLHPGEIVRYMVPRHGFLGTIKEHVEGFLSSDGKAVSALKLGTDGKPFNAINPGTFIENIDSKFP